MSFSLLFFLFIFYFFILSPSSTLVGRPNLHSSAATLLHHCSHHDGHHGKRFSVFFSYSFTVFSCSCFVSFFLCFLFFVFFVVGGSLLAKGWWQARWIRSDWKRSEGKVGSFKHTVGKWSEDPDDKVRWQSSKLGSTVLLLPGI